MPHLSGPFRSLLVGLVLLPALLSAATEIHVATKNHLNAPNYILDNWLYDVWGYEQKPWKG